VGVSRACPPSHPDVPSFGPLDLQEVRKDYGYHRGEVIVMKKPEVMGIESTNYCNTQCIMYPRGEPDLMRRPLGFSPDTRGNLERSRL
jgi:hypothetical protein